jgi:hypothetical protein
MLNMEDNDTPRPKTYMEYIKDTPDDDLCPCELTMKHTGNVAMCFQCECSKNRNIILNKMRHDHI